MIESEFKYGDYSFQFKSLNKLYIDVKKCGEIDAQQKKSLIEKCVIFIITKNNLSRINKTLPQFYYTPYKIIILDDSTNDETKDFVIKYSTNNNINYHGKIEKEKFIQKFDNSINVDVDVEFFISKPSDDSWNLGCARNYAILLARTLGYKKILMIDDDILIDDFNVISNTFYLLSKFDVVGAKTNGMPDDSIVGHIFRNIGIQQYDFISGQYVAINLDSMTYPFQNVYNEDWITFILESVNLKLARFSSIHQLPYDPFINTINKILFQEKGEIICLGVIESVFEKDIYLLCEDSFWYSIIEKRMHDVKKLETISIKNKNSKYRNIFSELMRYYSSVEPSVFTSPVKEYFNSIKYWSYINEVAQETSKR